MSDQQLTTVSGREQLLSSIFVSLADTLVDDYDVVDLLDRLVNTCVNLLGVTAAGLLLDDQKGPLAVVASSGEETRLLEVFQLQTNDGPCLDTFTSGQPVTSPDLSADADHWPLFVPAAIAAGFASVAAVPLRLRAQTIGALNLFHAEPEIVPEKDVQLAQALADVATIGILRRRLTHRGTLLAEQLQHALSSRVVIEQAKGALTERHGLSMDTAFETLRQHARNGNLKLTDVALAVARGELDPDAAPRPAPGLQGASASTA